MRKLATIQKVQALHEIKGADFIEICQINGWQCITKKGEVKLNDLVVYFEIDSFLPADKEQFEFLKKSGTDAEQPARRGNFPPYRGRRPH